MSARDYAGVEAEVFDELRLLMALPPDVSIRADQLVIDDLGLDSLDLVELIYRLERRFSVTIEEGTLLRLARGDLSDDDFFDDIYLSPIGLERVRAMLFDTPAARFPADVHRSTVPLYATAGAFARVVHRLLALP